MSVSNLKCYRGNYSFAKKRSKGFATIQKNGILIASICALALLSGHRALASELSTTTAVVGNNQKELLTTMTCSDVLQAATARKTQKELSSVEALTLLNITLYLKGFALGRNIEFSDARSLFAEYCRSHPERQISNFN